MKRISLSIFMAFCYFMHAQKTYVAVAHDTPYGISKKYNLSLEEFYRLNPKVKEQGLSIGDVVIVSPTGQNTQSSITSDMALGEIVVQPKQTLYSITHQYNISVADLKKLNPGLDADLQIGQQIKLPLAYIQRFSEASPSTPQPVPQYVNQAPEGGETYLVQPKDTFYKIAKLYNLSYAEIYEMNPGLKERGLHPGDVVVVRKGSTTTQQINNSVQPASTEDKEKEVAETPSYTAPPSVESEGSPEISAKDPIKYKVKQGDTVFKIINKFGISLDELIAMNPQLVNGLKVGMVLTLKRTTEQEEVASFTKTEGEALQVVMMLPFDLDKGSSKYRKVALEFLKGAKLAIERNAADGKKLNIKVVDEGNKANFNQALSYIVNQNVNLVVGPFFKSNIEKLLYSLSSKKEVPVISPFANAKDLYSYDNLVIVNTDPQYFASRIADEVERAYNGEKIYIVGTDYAKHIAAELKTTLKTAEVKIVKSAADIVPEQNMMTGKTVPLIAVLASDKPADRSAFFQKLLELGAQSEGNKAFSMFYDSIFDEKQNLLQHTSFVYIVDRKINLQGKFEQEVLKAYQEKYCEMPSKYAVIGFDVVNDALSREDKQGRIFKHMKDSKTQLATKFDYEKTKEGAYINTGYRVVRVLPQ